MISLIVILASIAGGVGGGGEASGPAASAPPMPPSGVPGGLFGGGVSSTSPSPQAATTIRSNEAERMETACAGFVPPPGARGCIGILHGTVASCDVVAFCERGHWRTIIWAELKDICQSVSGAAVERATTRQ